jgi:hypothetical protein
MYCCGQLNDMIVFGEQRATVGEDYDCVAYSLIFVVIQNYVEACLSLSLSLSFSLFLSLSPVFYYVWVCLPSIEQLLY